MGEERVQEGVQERGREGLPSSPSRHTFRVPSTRLTWYPIECFWSEDNSGVQSPPKRRDGRFFCFESPFLLIVSNCIELFDFCCYAVKIGGGFCLLSPSP